MGKTRREGPFKMIDNLQGKTRDSILTTFDTRIDAADEFSEVFFNKICTDKLDHDKSHLSQAPHHITTVLPIEVREPPGSLHGSPSDS